MSQRSVYQLYMVCAEKIIGLALKDNQDIANVTISIFKGLFSPWSMLELNALYEAHDLSNSMLTPLPTKTTSSTWYSYEYSSMLVEIWQPL